MEKTDYEGRQSLDKGLGCVEGMGGGRLIRGLRGETFDTPTRSVTHRSDVIGSYNRTVQGVEEKGLGRWESSVKKSSSQNDTLNKEGAALTRVCELYSPSKAVHPQSHNI